MKHKEYNFTYQNTQFYAQYFLAKQPKASVILIHGLGEHCNRYNHVIEKLTVNGFSVFTYDQFGHGKTEGKRGHNLGFEHVLECVSIMIQKATEIQPNLPVFLYGHSMGGNVVLNYALRKNQELKGVIATSPFLKLAFQPPALKLAAGKLLQKIAPSLTLGNELDVNILSRDKNEVQKYVDDALVHDKVSPNYSITFIKTGIWAIENAKNIQIPCAIFHGDGDSITSFEASKEFVEKSDFCTFFGYKNGFHELHNDLCKEELLQDIIDWLKTKL